MSHRSGRTSPASRSTAEPDKRLLVAGIILAVTGVGMAAYDSVDDAFGADAALCPGALVPGGSTPR